MCCKEPIRKEFKKPTYEPKLFKEENRRRSQRLIRAIF
ncbi:hypothetical protein CAEBREN_13693 [Caenorhabditis brenneri]|uniref:Uncharacterized protein n=1 Tax=Caenorhabditis brenneri TaxID=135651 RepID=G0MCZ8_CAEBE|nr:hypothetical protein CAEBREN_13693 [Caenorhabditis brenneri]